MGGGGTPVKEILWISDGGICEMGREEIGGGS